MREIGHRLGDHIRIGNDQACPVEGLDLGGADGNAPHVALTVPDSDPVADLDRPLDQQHKAGDEVVDDRLQAETDTDGKRAGHDGEARDVEAGVAYGHEQSDREADVARARVDGIDEAGVPVVALRACARLQPALHEARCAQQGDEQDEGEENARQRDADAVDLEPEDGRPQPANDVGDRDAPGKQQNRNGDAEQQNVEHDPQGAREAFAPRLVEAEHALAEAAEPVLLIRLARLHAPDSNVQEGDQQKLPADQ